MAVTVSLATASDVPTLAEIQRLGFRPNPLSSILYSNPDDPSSTTPQITRFLGALGDPQKVLLKAVDDAGRTVGMAFWVRPDAEGARKDEGEEEEREWPAGVDGKKAQEFFARADAFGERHWHLKTLSVDPQVHRTGAGRALLEWGLKKADEEGLPVYLAATESGIPFYERNGFSHVREPVRGNAGKEDLVLYPMLRPAPPPASAASALPPPIPLVSPTPTARTPPTVLPATSSDLPTLARIQCAAFRDTAISRLIFPRVTDAAHAQQATKRLAEALEDEGQRVVKAVDEEGTTVGFGLWEVPKWGNKDGEEKEEGEKPKREWPEGTNVELAEDFFGRLNSKIDEPHYHLSVLVVDPTKHRNGAGSAILKWGCHKADEEGVPMHLESTPLAVEVYRRAGFSELGPPVTGGPNEEIKLYPMSRPAASVPPNPSLSRPPPTILPALPTDLPALSRIQNAAFHSSAIWGVLFAGVTAAAHAEQLTKRLAAALESPRRAVVKAVDGTGEVVGWALWEVPNREEGEGREGEEQEKEKEKEKPKREWPEGTNVALAEEFFGSMSPRMEQPHYHLSILVVDPTKARNGAGSALVKWGCRKADEEGVPMDLKSTPLAVELYRRAGFSESGPPVVGGPNEEIKLYPMTRPALTIAPCTSSDIPHLPPLYVSALGPTRSMQYCFSAVTLESYTPWYEKRMRAVLATRDSGEKEVQMIVAKRGDAVVGLAHWERVPAKSADAKDETVEKEVPELPDGADEGRTRELIGKINACVREVEGPKWWLHNLTVLPAAQGQGIGKLLMDRYISLARESGEKATLESSEVGIPLYRKYGFVRSGPPICADDPPSLELLYPMQYTPPARADKLTIAPCTASDIPSLPLIYSSALGPTRVNQYCYPSVTLEAYTPWYKKRMRAVLAARESGEKKVEVLLAKRGASVVGLAYWEYVARREKVAEGQAEEKPVEVDVKELPEGADETHTRELLGKINRYVAETEGPHWWLHNLAVLPAAQGQGIGKLLMDRFMDVVKASGVKVTLESSEFGLELYRKYGFVSSKPPICADDPPTLELIYPMEYLPTARVKPASTMPVALTIAPLTTADIPSLPLIYQQSFGATAINRFLFPSVTYAAYEPWFTARMQRVLAARDTAPPDSNAVGEVLVARREADGKIVGFAYYDLVPHEDQREAVDPKKRTFPEGADVERAMKLLGAMDEWGASIKGAHLALHILAVSPDTQGQGVGKALLRATMDRARAKGVKVTLESTEFGIELYKKHNFVTNGPPLGLDGTEYLWPMHCLDTQVAA